MQKFLHRSPLFAICCLALRVLALGAALDGWPSQPGIALAQPPSQVGSIISARSDTVNVKLRLLREAHATGNHDLAMSLAESVKNTLALTRQIQPLSTAPQLPTDRFISVAQLPLPWEKWSDGWSYCKRFSLCETAGIERRGEPVEVTVAFHVNQVTDLQREIRIARVDRLDHSLHEIRSQVYGERFHRGERQCRIVLLADVPARGQTDYLLLYGNPFAERPNYPSDLQVAGEGFGLDVENRHFFARLSRQMGQLERLTYKRQHGLELYAGGKGHGEPPTIDWAHDYVDANHFQKFRLRNWSDCPNFEVVRGPLCVRVRRWGFPHSPLHPVFAPSRLHLDQTYIFYAGQPYFLKESRFNTTVALTVDALRDDEWVFSGYSFSDTLWLDSDGKLHEGAVPEHHAENLWGVGFYHRISRDAFMALWLNHTSQGIAEISHSGVPTLNYEGHGQLWSRAPVARAELPAGASLYQRNAYVVSPYPQSGGAAAMEQLRRSLIHSLTLRFESAPVAKAHAHGRLARAGETPATAGLKPAIWQALKGVRDEQLYTIDANVVDMGYVYDVQVHAGVVTLLVTMPHRGRPNYNFLVTQGGGRLQEGIAERVRRIDGVRDVVVKFTWEPAWTVARLTEAGRTSLGLE